MKLVCPICQSEYPLEAALNDVAARKAVIRAFELTDIGGLLVRYVQLFKPAKQALSMARLAKLIDELVPMVKDAQITRGGTIHPAPKEYWQQAIETTLANRDKLSLPLKGHGYLLEIIAGLSNKAAAVQEKKQEAKKRNRTTKPGTTKAATSVKGSMPAHVTESLRQFSGKKDK